MTNVKEALFKSYITGKEIHELYCPEDEYPKILWAANEVFDIYTDDENLDIEIGKQLIESCKVILNYENYEYIQQSEENYKKFMMCILWFDKLNWVDCGTSARGSWFDKYNKLSKYIVGGEGFENSVPFSVENLRELIDFIESEGE